MEGRGGPLSWAATLTNGTGINQPDVNGAKSVTGRLVWHVVSRLRLAGQLSLHDRLAPEPGGGTVYDGAWGVDAGWGGFRDGLHLQAAVVGGENGAIQAPAAGPPSFLAAQLVGRWYRPVGDGSEGRVTALEPVLRVGWADPERGGAADRGLLVTPGFAAYVGGPNKVAVNLDVYDPGAGDVESSLKVQVWLQF